MFNQNKDEPISTADANFEDKLDTSEHEQIPAKTPATSLLPRKRHAVKSPVPPGSGESSDVAPDVDSALNDGKDDDEERPFLNRNLHSAFDSTNKDNTDDGESCIDDGDAVEDPKAAFELNEHEQQQQSQSPSELRKKGKQKNKQMDDENKSSWESARPRSATLHNRQQSPPRIQQLQPQQQQQQASHAHTPVRPPKTQKQKRYRHSSETLFSPKPMNRRRAPNSTTVPSTSGIDRRPPRPVASTGDELAQSPETSQEATPLGNESYNTSNTTTTTGSGYDSSPATPFRFHAFPASLPRVHLKNDVSYGGGFSSTPFRLDESLDASQQMSTGDTKYLRPKPTPSIHAGIPSKQPLPPLSPATRRLFDMNRDTRQILPTAPSFETVDEGAVQDISGDWSDSGMTFTNERMKMAIPTTMTSIPSHVTSHESKVMPNEGHEDPDTLMDGDDLDFADADLDRKMPGDDIGLMQDINNAESMSDTKLNVNLFYSPPQSSNLSNPSTGQTSNQSTLETTLHPHTPRSLSTEQFNIHNLEVSPIIRRSEDDDVDGGIVMKGSLDDEESFKDRVDRREHRSQQLFQDGSSAKSNFNQPNENEVNTSAASSSMFSVGNATVTSASTANINNTTAISNISSSTRPQTRKLRPMPDNSAFDFGTPSQQSLGSRDSGATSHKTSTSGLLCPPTPIRTPAWAHAEARPTFQRANSLIATKVLAACPPRVLDNLSSLEDSLLENDISGCTMDHDSHRMLNSSFAPVDEKDEDDSFENEGMLFPLSENFDEQMSPMKDASSAAESNNVSKQDTSTETITNKDPPSAGEHDLGSVSFTSDFINLGILGSGAFADVYKVRSKQDQACYAIKRTRRQFRGVKDRERAMAEVETMQRLQVALESVSTSATHSYGLYLLFFRRAWQEDGYFFCQTELCSRATCRQLRLSLTSEWTRDIVKYPSLRACLDPSEGTDELQRLLPERAIWQVCHDISRGLFHIHSHGMVHYDIKPSNIFFVYNARWGTICKIGDFGLAGNIGTIDDGQEGDTAYMPNELLSSCAKHPGADIFSLGLTLYELSSAVTWTLPREGERWHDLRSGSHSPNIPASRSKSLAFLIQSMIRPNAKERPSAEDVSEHVDAKCAGASSDSFLSQYVKDVELYDSMRERDLESAEREARRRSSTPVAPIMSHHSGNDGQRTWSTRTPT